MGILNWRKKKDEERTKQMMEPRAQKSPVIEDVSKSSSEVAVAPKVAQPEKKRSTGNAHHILIKPLITEKNTMHQSQNQYVFEVARDTNKIEVKKAVETVFKVKVSNVRMANYRGKIKQFGRMNGVRNNWKKAIVTVAKGDQITLLSSV